MKTILALLLILSLLFSANINAYGNDTWDTYSDTWVLYDALGRETPGISDTGKTKDGKYVLMFYHIWHSDFMNPTIGADSKAPRNSSRIIKENEDALTNPNYWGPNITYHYWGEPLFGYYDLSKDEYVIRKHAQMLTDAGVDAIVIDYSNYMGDGSFSYTKKALTNLLDVFNKIRNEGMDTPYVTLLCTWGNTESAKAAEDFYKDFYSDKQYENLWFKWENKPLILANPAELSEELKEFFTVRRPHPFYTPVTEENAWPWLSIYPQDPGYTKDNPREIVSVGVAQNWSSSLDFMSARDSDGNFISRGRSYTSKNQKLLKNPVSSDYESEKGYNFQECFDRAIELDPTALFITGWNEWISARFLQIPSWAAMSKDPVAPFGGFCDVFSTEFSRDIEPTREGELKDNFYNQLVINIRRFKGSGVSKYSSQQKTIKVDGDFSDWQDIKQEYRDDISDISIRNAKGIGKQNVYVNETGRNDFKISKVTYDKENIYFYVNTADPITSYDDNMWMNLFIRVKGDKSHNKSWEGFQYIVNRSNVDTDYTRLERSTGGWNWEVMYDFVGYKVKGSEMEMAIPLYALDIDYKKGIDIEFKWFDNMQTEGDALEFYVNGDAAPNERFAYSFNTEISKDTDSKPIYILVIASVLILISVLIVLLMLKKRKR